MRRLLPADFPKDQAAKLFELARVVIREAEDETGSEGLTVLQLLLAFDAVRVRGPAEAFEYVSLIFNVANSLAQTDDRSAETVFEHLFPTGS